jgi:RNA polymerase sigma-70 factor (ECF subfamily)
VERDLLAQLYEKYYRAAFLYTCSLCHDAHLSEDIVQESFVRAYLSLPGDSPSFSCWLMTVCRHLVIDYLRRQKHLSDAALPDLAGVGGPEEALLQQENTRQLYRAMQQLAPGDREILTLCYFVRLPMSQIASVLHLSVAATKVRLHRARGRLRVKMEENGYEI